MHAICVDKIEELYPQVVDATQHDRDSLIGETAIWAMARLGLAPS